MSAAAHIGRGPAAVDAVNADVDASALTRREREILRVMAEGKSNQEIADALFVSKRTVDFHLGNVYRKLGVDCRTAAIREGLRRGILDS